MKILLVKPPFNSYSFIRHFMVCEPLEFEVLAAALGPAHDVMILDMRVDHISLESYLESFRPDVVGFTALTMDVNTVRRLSSRVKSLAPNVATCVGGEHASFCPEDFEGGPIDFVIQYDGTSAFGSLLAEIERARSAATYTGLTSLPRRWGQRDVQADIDSADLPRRDLTKRYRGKYIYGCATPVNLIQMSSGCAYRCTYCSIPARFPNFRTRSIDRVIEDMASTPSVDLLSIDANALQNLKYAKELYGAISDAKLRKRVMISCRTDTIVRNPEILEILRTAGVSVVSFGMETFDDSRLTEYDKVNTGDNNRTAVRLVHEHGMLVRGNFIIDQRFDHDDFQRLVDSISTVGVDFPSFQILTPLPGTQIYLDARGRSDLADLDYFDLSHTVLPPETLSVEDFHEEFRRLFRQCYSATKLLRLAARVPLWQGVKGLVAALRSHAEFSYRNHAQQI